MTVNDRQEPEITHDAVRMPVVDRYNRVKVGPRRSWRVWWDVRVCPTCEVRKDTLHNTNVNRDFFCNGARVVSADDGRAR